MPTGRKVAPAAVKPNSSSVAGAPQTSTTAPAAVSAGTTARTCAPTPPALVARTSAMWRPDRGDRSATVHLLPTRRAQLAHRRGQRAARRTHDDRPGDDRHHRGDEHTGADGGEPAARGHRVGAEQPCHEPA